MIETIEALDKLEAPKHITTSELVWVYVDRVLYIESGWENIEFIAWLIQQKITSAYHMDEIKAIVDFDVVSLEKC